MFSNLKHQYKNAKALINQLKNGEWEFSYNNLSCKCCKAKRGELYLWVANGAFFLEIQDKDPLPIGLIFRHWVWWAAARKATKEANKRLGKKETIRIY